MSRAVFAGLGCLVLPIIAFRRPPSPHRLAVTRGGARGAAGLGDRNDRSLSSAYRAREGADDGRIDLAARFVIKKTSNGQYRFVLHAANREPLATSETYTTKSAARTGIDSVKANAGAARVDDETGEG
jgi:uncharacterized protein